MFPLFFLVITTSVPLAAVVPESPIPRILDAVSSIHEAEQLELAARFELAADKQDLATDDALFRQAETLYAKRAISREEFHGFRAKRKASLHKVDESTGRIAEAIAWQKLYALYAGKELSTSPEFAALARAYATVWKAKSVVAAAAFEKHSADREYRELVLDITRRLHIGNAAALKDLWEAERAAVNIGFKVAFFAKRKIETQCYSDEFAKAAENGGKMSLEEIGVERCRKPS